jgi:hypothetical protein
VVTPLEFRWRFVVAADGDFSKAATAGVLADQSRPVQQIILALLNDAAIRRVQVLWIGGKLARLGPHVHGDRFVPLISCPSSKSCR